MIPMQTDLSVYCFIQTELFKTGDLKISNALIQCVIIKSRVEVSKFAHIFISLPAPPNGLISELEKKSFYGIPARQNIACAGLRMIELQSFIKALKVSWLGRILQQSKPNE